MQADHVQTVAAATSWHQSRRRPAAVTAAAIAMAQCRKGSHNSHCSHGRNGSQVLQYTLTLPLPPPGGASSAPSGSQHGCTEYSLPFTLPLRGSYIHYNHERASGRISTQLLICTSPILKQSS